MSQNLPVAETGAEFVWGGLRPPASVRCTPAFLPCSMTHHTPDPRSQAKTELPECPGPVTMELL